MEMPNSIWRPYLSPTLRQSRLKKITKNRSGRARGGSKADIKKKLNKRTNEQKKKTDRRPLFANWVEKISELNCEDMILILSAEPKPLNMNDKGTLLSVGERPAFDTEKNLLEARQDPGFKRAIHGDPSF